MSFEASRRNLPSISADSYHQYTLSDKIDCTYTYGILSPAVFRRNSEEDWVHILHVWGVNSESKKTQDWKAIVEPNTSAEGINLDGFANAYRARMEELFAVIKTAIVETADILTHNHPGINAPDVHIPGIGLNSFLKSLNSQDLKDACIFEFLKVMNDVLFAKSDAELLSNASADTKRRQRNGTFRLRLSWSSSMDFPRFRRLERAKYPSS